MLRPLYEEGVCPETGFHYTVLAGVPGGRASKDTLIAFCGGLMAIQPMLESGRLTDNDTCVQTAIGMIDKIATQARNPNTGFYWDGYKLDEGWCGCYWLDGDPHSAYPNGQAAFFLTRAHMMEKDRGFDHPRWLDAAGSIVHAAIERQLDDGHFPLTVATDDGRVLDPDGFAGCWFAAAAALYAQATGDKAALHAAARACDAYDADLATLEILGSPHDINKAPDEESSLPMAKLARSLHEQTADPKYIDVLARTLEYHYTWKFIYNTRHRAGVMDWSSSGGDVTSTHNIHIHAMGSMIAGDIYYYWHETGDDHARSRLVDTILWGIQIHNRKDGQLGFGRVGWISEQYYHTDVKYQKGEADGGVWMDFLPWGIGAILSSLTDGVPQHFLDQIAPPVG